MYKAPYVAHQLVPPAQHAYAEPAGDKKAAGMEPYTSKQDFTGFSTGKKFQTTNDFLKYIKGVENSIRKGFSDGKWRPYPAVEGGKSWDIAYGHKITKTDDLEKFRNGITDQEAVALLQKDLEHAQKEVELYLKKNRLPSNLSQKQWEILTDYSFNLGTVGKFPEMVKAVVFQDLPKAQREYKRYATIQGKKQELARNSDFFKRYLTAPLTENYE
jgi:GH24 family phage-related lysozyme (muramidase)